MTEGPGMQQWHMELKSKRAITSGKQENTEQDLQANHSAGGLKANNRAFQWTAENECQVIMEGSAPS
jgi:hypothetical protein